MNILQATGHKLLFIHLKKKSQETSGFDISFVSYRTYLYHTIRQRGVFCKIESSASCPSIDFTFDHQWTQDPRPGFNTVDECGYRQPF